MRNVVTIKDILSSKVGLINQHLNLVQPKQKKPVKPRNDCKEVVKMHWDLKYWCQENGIRFEYEYKWAKGRKYRADFALPDNFILIEYQGLNSAKSGHSTLVGYTRDTERMKLAQELGFTILYYTVLNYKNVLQDIQKIIKK